MGLPRLRGHLFKADEPVGTAQVYGGTQGSVPVAAKVDLHVLLPRTSQDKLSGRLVYEGPVIAPVQAGQKIGHIEIKRGASVILDQPVFATEAVEQGSLPRRAFDAAYETAAAAIHDRLDRLKKK